MHRDRVKAGRLSSEYEIARQAVALGAVCLLVGWASVFIPLPLPIPVLAGYPVIAVGVWILSAFGLTYIRGRSQVKSAAASTPSVRHKVV